MRKFDQWLGMCLILVGLGCLSPFCEGSGLEAGASARENLEVRSPGVILELSPQGEIVGVTLRATGPGKRELRRSMRGGTFLAGCPVHHVTWRRLARGGLEFHKLLADGSGKRACTLIERFSPAANSVRWEIEIRGAGDPWTTPIETRLSWPVSQNTKFWAAWSDPELKISNRKTNTAAWNDPLVFKEFRDLKLPYGAPIFDPGNPRLDWMPLMDDMFCIPLATVAEPAEDLALSLVLSPEDTMLDMTLTTDQGGSIVFSRLKHRIGAARPLRFAMDLASHPADWRGGLAWMVKRYPEFFKPPNPKAAEIAGCAAYSHYTGPLDAGKFQKMAFRVNWRASFDWPYMGMFIPPVKSDTEQWEMYNGDSGGNLVPGKFGLTSIRQMNDYSKRMKAMGFYVLDYFNFGEFGKWMKGPAGVSKNIDPAKAWKNPDDFLYTRIADGLYYDRNGRPYPSWGGAVAMDVGAPHFRAFILDQARRHLQCLPDSSGICIDRGDWQRFYNQQADDGVSWVDGRPARSLVMSWKNLMAELGPLFHGAGKVIYASNQDKRLDILREVDGMYCEFSNACGPLNCTSLQGVDKPVMAWTRGEEDLRPDPDAFFQKYLHMGMFPTAPFPGNDHSLNPSDWADRAYLDYGPLLDKMRGKQWVLIPHVVRVAGDGAKINLFKVGRGRYVMPVTFGGKAGKVKVILRKIGGGTGGNHFCAYYPGVASGTRLEVKTTGEEQAIEVPLHRGCAMATFNTFDAKAEK